MEWYLKAAKKNNVAAQYAVARCFEDGLGNNKEAHFWYSEVAKQGNVYAEYAMGRFFE